MLETIDLLIIISAGIGQTIFFFMWVMLPWWREWIGRALMIKAAALMVFIDTSLLWAFTDLEYEEVGKVVSHGLVAFGIWAQVVALMREKRHAKAAHRAVSGTSNLADENEVLRLVISNEVVATAEAMNPPAEH